VLGELVDLEERTRTNPFLGHSDYTVPEAMRANGRGGSPGLGASR